jgi:phosphate transport system permease protein
MSSGRITLDSLPPVSARRRNTDRAMRWLMWVAVGIALVPLVLIIYYLIHKGAGQWTGSFFSSDPNGNFFGNHGGIRSAILGTLEIIGIASVVAIPIGISVALYLTEYGKNSRLANVVRYFVDVMTGVPSIVFGLFIYITLVISNVGGSSFAGWKGAVAVTLLMLPIVVRSAEVVLLLVPSSLREAALALGAPRWRVITRVVLPTSLSGLVTGSLLAVARGMGETAPLLFTVSYTMNLTGNPNTLMNSLPVQIYNDIHSPEAAVQARAWGGALTLVALVLIINLIARAVSRRSRMT